MKDLKRIWTPPKFRKIVYERKAENPDKTIIDVLNDMADEETEKKKKKRGGFDYF